MTPSLKKLHAIIKNKNVLVLGSAPNCKIPKEYSDQWGLICINASGYIAYKMKLADPDITIMTISAVLNKDESNLEAQKNLKGLKTNSIIIRYVKNNLIKIMYRIFFVKKFFQINNFTYNSFYKFPPKIWKPVIKEILREDTEIANNISTGVFAILLAYYLGATRVYCSGIDPNQNGHAYSKKNLKRSHKLQDQKILNYLSSRKDLTVLL